MAESKEVDHRDLTQCGICLSTQQDPKSLPCLHSYCLECLTQWANGKTKISCPTCLQEFDIPSDGVKAFRTNFFINKLKERHTASLMLKSRDTIVPCSSCGAVDEQVDGHCSTCGGFVCENCFAMHNTLKLFSNHKVIPYENLKSGKVDIRNLSQKKFCKIHADQPLWFFCESCGMLTCRDCTVVDHPSSSHSLVNLETVSKGQRKEIEQLIKDCDGRRQGTVDVLKEIEEAVDLLERDGSQASAQIDEAFDTVLTYLEDQRKELKAEIQNGVYARKKQLDAQEDKFILLQTRVETILQMATEVVTTGSDYDLALIYKSLKMSLTRLRDVTLPPVDRTMGSIYFKPAEVDQESIPKLGSVAVRKHKEGVGEWKVESAFGTNGAGKLKGGRNVTITQEGELAVADCMDSAIKIYSKEGQLKFSIKVPGTPWDVQVNRDGHLFVTNQTATVRIYDVKGNLKHRFPTRSHDNVSSEAQATSHWGLAIDNSNQLLVGEGRRKYISKHQQDGRHITSFKVSIMPKYIAVSPENKIIISCGSDGCKTQVLNKNGVLLHSLKLPQGSIWTPLGLCCTSSNEIYLCDYTSDAVYGYSAETGAYIGCVTKEVKYPAGLVLMDDEQTLVVAQKEDVKILQVQ